MSARVRNGDPDHTVLGGGVRLLLEIWGVGLGFLRDGRTSSERGRIHWSWPGCLIREMSFRLYCRRCDAAKQGLRPASSPLALR